MADPDERAEFDVSRLNITLLGVIGAEIDGRALPINAARQRAVLSVLALQVGRPVSADQLLDAVWGDDAPQTGSRAVAYQISKLRTIFEADRVGEGTVISTSAAGYSLNVDPDRVDAVGFDRLIDDGRASLGSDPANCERLLEEALALWRGRPFAELADEPFLAAEARRLERRHTLARRTMAEARMAQGRHVDAVPDLEAMVGEEPLEETPVRLLMTALHRVGRTADALRAFGELRLRLGDELGIEPSSDLRRLESQLLTGGEHATNTPDGDSQPPVRSVPPRRPTPVPAPPSSFIGRRAELAEVSSLLGSVRLVTLSGFGGLGKTRLAKQIAANETARYADGVWFADLTAIADGALLADSLIAAGGGGVSNDREPIELLLALLEPLDVLLAIDNCEHLIDEVAALVTRIIAVAPGVRVLATSRRSLGVDGEVIRPLPPLDPDAARELFVDRARQARAGFTADESNDTAIDRLCDRLEGIPLAIEMAAARLSVLSVDQIGEHLDDRFQLLTRGERAVVQKQRSLTAVMDWSYDLLEAADQRLLQRLSVFADGFDLDAALALRPSELAATEILDRLAHLVEMSLVRFSDRDGVPRYELLETVREYAAARLDPIERDEAALTHATHYAAVAAALNGLSQNDLPALLATGDRELGNFRTAMAWSYEAERPLIGLAIIDQIRAYMWSKMMNREILYWLTGGIDLIAGDGPEVLRAAAVAVVEAFNVGDRAAGQAAVDRIAAGIDAVEDDELRALLLVAMGTHTIETAPSTADDYYSRAAALPGLTQTRVLSILNNRVEVSWISGALPDGDAIAQRLVAITEALPAAAPMAAKIEAGVAARAGRWEDVIRIAEAATGLDPANEAAVQITYAEALGAMGRFDEALAALDQLDLVAHGHYERNADLVHASISLDRGDPVTAMTRLDDLVAMIGRDQPRIAIAVPVAALLASVACELDRYEAAATISGFVDAECRRLSIGLRPTDRRLLDAALERCRASLGQQRVIELADMGATLSWAELPIGSLVG